MYLSPSHKNYISLNISLNSFCLEILSIESYHLGVKQVKWSQVPIFRRLRKKKHVYISKKFEVCKVTKICFIVVVAAADIAAVVVVVLFSHRESKNGYRLSNYRSLTVFALAEGNCNR